MKSFQSQNIAWVVQVYVKQNANPGLKMDHKGTS